jgi:TPP-dependent pyruvate/acetoin dehydrogenase alpha subunit
MRPVAVREAPAAASIDAATSAGLDRADLTRMYEHMLLTRGLEDRGTTLFKQGRLPGSFYTGRGNEAASVGVASAMRDGDVAAPLHRNMGVHIVRGAEPWRLLCQYMGRDGGATRGRDSNLRSQDLDRGLIAGVSHLPGILPTATGAALAFRISARPNVALGWFGDGASARGDVHECMNFAAVRRLPMVFVCDNNQYAYSTPTNLNYACEHLADRAASYGFEGVVVDGTDVVAVFREARAAIEKARAGGGPTMLELVTLRMDGHAIHDDASYVPADLHAAWLERDPITRFELWLRTHAGLTDAEAAAIAARVAAAVDEATRLAEASPWPDPATVTDGVYA